MKSSLSNLFSDYNKKHTYFVTKIFPFSLKGAAKIWYDNLSPGYIDSPIGLVNAFFQKYFPTSAQHAALQKIFDFVKVGKEKLPESWAVMVVFSGKELLLKLRNYWPK